MSVNNPSQIDLGFPFGLTRYQWSVFFVVSVGWALDATDFGLYSLVENVDNDFVADRKLGKGGAILKPSTPEVFADLGDDWSAYEQGYDPKSELTDEQRRRVIALCRLITYGTDEEVAARLGDFIDLDEFARFLAVTAWVGRFDGLLGYWLLPWGVLIAAALWVTRARWVPPARAG